MADFFDNLRRERAASGDVAEELGRLIRVLGTAVSEKEDGGFRGGRDERVDAVGAVASAAELKRAVRRDRTGTRGGLRHLSPLRGWRVAWEDPRLTPWAALLRRFAAVALGLTS